VIVGPGSYTGITGVGTLTAGTWNATPIADAYIASASTWNAKMTNPMTTVGDIIYGGTSGAPTRLAGSAGFLKSTGAAAPSWTTLSASDIPSLDANKITSGILPVVRGGTAPTLSPVGYLIKGNGTNALSSSVIYDNGTNVGIGTTSPAYKLDVVGDIKASGSVYGTYAGTIGASKVAQGQFGADTGGGNYSFPASVGIGTTSPSANLHLKVSSGDIKIRLGTQASVIPATGGPIIPQQQLMIQVMEARLVGVVQAMFIVLMILMRQFQYRRV